ncbi:MAG: cytochrome d ubiquinol oxidase subunit II [Flavobacterium sp.]|jgi:cytochrome d ubiquinol oxidase subunit II|uniref:Cytochrome bd-I ubiquinol oxidase subunit 2 apoprotein n=2 Tax=Flavobacterium TaxID=237 RepID=A0A1M5Q8C5_9FLAO|nr:MULTISPECIES: cytochrome d ubiquinol oxidase subunit II [Flavobacterium]MDD2820027.1 cytochrome d ubiquinol oxidase subunit II [Flavobacterium sp.]PRZ22116.1 cytochrome bd-I ubiquinol oxidase subunit 2 apoprotein [Flavobacterium granuli]RBN49395.1 cytochrome d ubiquinol oxidase subunit II [Flavobacterium psychrolimnae]SHH10325.1 cytochrome bd-I ubiquinol oxidase subunit 2 apoprotein [Flavobacterium granuli]
MEYFLGVDYPTLWYLVIGLLFSGYAILEGFDFGAGAWHLFLKKDLSRRIAINAIAPVWDANQVWLVIGGGALFAGFPVMYATMLSAMYVPFMLFLMFNVLRAVAIKFRSDEEMLWWRKTWDYVYSISSIMISFLLGVVLGNILQGFALGPNFAYKGDMFFSFLSPYAIMVGLTTLSLFMTQGAIYLLLKTEGRLHARLTFLLKKGMIFFIISFGITTLYTLVFIPEVTANFRANPLYFVVPLISFLAVANVPRLASKKRYMLALVFSSLTMAFLLVLVALQLYPTLLISTIDPKYSVTIYNAASSQKSLGIMLTIVVIGTPLLAAYFIFLYRTFNGKVKLDDTSY